MALRLPLRHQLTALARSGAVGSPRVARRCFASAAGSNLAESVKQAINVSPRASRTENGRWWNTDRLQHEASLPNPDPATDSASAALINEHAPYMVATYARPPPVFVQAEGSYIYDIENRKYLDFTAGIAVNSLGHCDPEFANIIADQVSLHERPLSGDSRGLTSYLGQDSRSRF